MEFLKSLLLKEARMKDAAMDLVYQAADAVPKSDDKEKYLMKVAAKVLSLDKDKLFKGDAVAAEKMVKQVLESVVVEGKGYQEVKLKDVVAELGGLEAIKKKVKDSDAAYSLLLKGQTAVVKKLQDSGVEEVGELNASDIADWCDNHFDKK